MFVVNLCLISFLATIVSPKISLLFYEGKAYLNGQYLVEVSHNGNIKDGIVYGYPRGLKLYSMKPLTLHEKLILGEQLKKSNDILSQLEVEKVKRLDDRVNELNKLFKREEKKRLKNLISENKVPQETIFRKKFEKNDGAEQNYRG